MCGLTGFWDQRAASAGEDLACLVRRMSDTLVRRGPDDSGVWVDAPIGIALGFRRLAVIDLSPNGHQPMTSADSRFVVIYNGEVYNYRELRAELKALGVCFRG